MICHTKHKFRKAPTRRLIAFNTSDHRPGGGYPRISIVPRFVTLMLSAFDFDRKINLKSGSQTNRFEPNVFGRPLLCEKVMSYPLSERGVDLIAKPAFPPDQYQGTASGSLACLNSFSPSDSPGWCVTALSALHGSTCGGIAPAWFASDSTRSTLCPRILRWPALRKSERPNDAGEALHHKIQQEGINGTTRAERLIVKVQWQR